MKLRLDLALFWKKPSCFTFASDAVLVLTSTNLYNKNSEVSIKASSVTKHKIGWEIELAIFSLKDKTILAF